MLLGGTRYQYELTYTLFVDSADITYTSNDLLIGRGIVTAVERVFDLLCLG